MTRFLRLQRSTPGCLRPAQGRERLFSREERSVKAAKILVDRRMGLSLEFLGVGCVGLMLSPKDTAWFAGWFLGLVCREITSGSALELQLG